MRNVRARLAVPAAFLFSAFLLAASPEPQLASDADCGANDGNVCWSNEECLNLLFYRMCTTRYKYYEGALLDPRLQP